MYIFDFTISDFFYYDENTLVDEPIDELIDEPIDDILSDNDEDEDNIRGGLKGEPNSLVMTPRQYHKKVMLFTLPQFMISFYSSLYTINPNSKKNTLSKYVYHTHHVILVLLSSILYWGNYDSENEHTRMLLRRFDMCCVLFSICSLYWRASRYSKGLTKASFFANAIFMGLYLLSHYFNKRYPYRSIWSHSFAHTLGHIYNVHYFMTIYRIAMWRRRLRGL